MSLQDDVRTLLVASSSLVTAFTGGIMVYDALGVHGLSRTLTTGAANATTGLIKPLIVIRERSQSATTAIYDELLQYRSYQQAVEIALYTDKTSGYGVLETGANTIYTLLNNKRTSSAALVYSTETRMERDRNFDNACIMQLVYVAYGVRTP